MEEIWKGIPGYTEKYEVSSLGNIRNIPRFVQCKGGVRSIKGKLLRQQVNYKGYCIIALSQGTTLAPKTYTVHQLVATAFIPNFVKGTELNHIDGIKTNNAVSNLEVSNPAHNQQHAVNMGLVPKVGISKYRNVSYSNNPRAIRRWKGSIRYAGNGNYGSKLFLLEEDAARHVDYLLDSVGDTRRIRNFP